MNLANVLTIARIVLSFAFMLVLFQSGLGARFLALFLFMFASLTDYLDGLVARRTRMVTNFGKFMDPLADKILVLAALISFVQLQIVPAWMVVMILSREIIITGFRVMAMGRGKFLAATRGGKHKTVSQVVSILAILLFLILKEFLSYYRIWTQVWDFYFHTAIYLLMLVTTVLTLISGISYIWQNRGVFYEGN